MLRAISLLAILVSWSALAQQPPTVTITSADRPIIQESLDKLGVWMQTHDPEGGMRLREVQHGLAFSNTVDPRNLPFLGMALSRNSQDPKACALLQRIEPSAVCVK